MNQFRRLDSLYLLAGKVEDLGDFRRGFERARGGRLDGCFDTAIRVFEKVKMYPLKSILQS